MTTNISTITAWFKELQSQITEALSHLDGKAIFHSDKWNREEGGGGDTRIIQNGNIFEKGGVNFSHVFGKLPEAMKSESRIADYFEAGGVSIVIHPYNPYVPIIHMNVRYFEMLDVEEGNYVDSWFGGGIDLSPAYPNEADTRFFHQSLKEVCDRHQERYYDEFKTWCDKYFWIAHRKQMRGVGGLFFDYLRPNPTESLDTIFSFVKEIAETFIPTYSEIVRRNQDRPFMERQKNWQLIRRGYYTEFNLVYDRGTHFGLKSGGRIESILMSLPPLAVWEYDKKFAKGSEEEKTLRFFQPIDWCK